MRTLILGLGLGLVVAACLATWVATSGGGHRPAPPRRDLSPAGLRRFDALPVYAAGGRVHGLPLTGNAVARSGGRADSVSLFYGTCPSGGQGPHCVYPLEIQSWRACDHSRAIALAAQRPRLKRLRGAQLATFADGRKEVYTGSSTVVIFGTPALTGAAASALTPLNARARRESSVTRLAKPRTLSVSQLAAC